MSETDKLVGQTVLANALEISDRRVRQLENLGVVVRHPGGNYDLELNRRRYRVFMDRDVDRAAAAVEEAASRADSALDQLRAEPNLEQRRLLAPKLGPAIGELDHAMRLCNAMAPEHQRELLNSFTLMVVGRAAGEFFRLCHWQLKDEQETNQHIQDVPREEGRRQSL